jgi:hypothetical protein
MLSMTLQRTQNSMRVKRTVSRGFIIRWEHTQRGLRPQPKILAKKTRCGAFAV